MPPPKTVITINSSGRQAASFVRVASAIGWKVRAQMRDRVGIVAQELCSLPNVAIIEGSLDDPRTLERLFSEPAQLAFINTTHWGDEVRIGKAIADAAKRAGIQHYIYSSMPDHSVYDRGWRALPLWASKFTVENYIRQIGLPATFVYTGIYHNNFTSLPYPLFRMELQPDDTFVWQAPFHPNQPLPWLDAEHDVGPAVLQILKEGPRKWGGKRVPLAFSHLTPRQVCKAFSRALDRPVRYVRGPVEIEIPVPTGYAEHLIVLEEVLGEQRAPYFGPDLEKDCTKTAIQLWEGYRDIEEYAREVFPLEEAANGLTWMNEGDETPTEINSDYQVGC